MINVPMLQTCALCLQDKRRIQEDIAKKRRQIEEEKLKLQYIKVCLKLSLALILPETTEDAVLRSLLGVTVN